MISNLVLCSNCTRHFRERDATCPFCGARVSLARTRPRPAPLPPGASRSRRYAAGAALLAGGTLVACTGDVTSTTSTIGDKDGGGGASDGGSDSGGRSTGGSGTGGRLINAGGTSAGGLGAGGASGSGAGGSSMGGALNTGGIAGGSTCAGATNPTGVLCRTNQDCTVAGGAGGFPISYLGCYMTAPPRGCGNPTFQPQQCTTDANCGDGGVCQTTACGGHLCAAACSPATCNGTNACVNGVCTPKRCDEPDAAPCATGFVCNPTDPTASTLGCVPVHCTSAADCDPGYDCSSSAPGKGCVHRPCTVDTECACGYCVNGYCEATLGFCYQFIAMPYGCVWPDEELV